MLLVVLTLLIALAIAPSIGHAYEFTPTDSEWHAWPGYCKAKYVWNQVGQRSKWARQVTEQQRQEMRTWEDAGLHGIHHYCTGAIWLQRALMEQDQQQRKYMLHNALNETLFTFNGSSGRSSRQFAYVAIQLARILYEQGEMERGVQELQRVLLDQPKTDVLYSAIAVMQNQLGKPSEAKRTLLQGFAAVDGNSAEISYNLGLICLELGETDEAVKYAELAYERGFPLPGLRIKLERMGKM